VRHPSDLTSEEMNQLEKFATNEYMPKRPATHARIADYLECELGVVMNVDAVQHVIARNPNLKCVVGRFMERKRVKVATEEIKAFYERLRTIISGLPASFIFNTNETGYQEWVNRAAVKVVVPIPHSSEIIDVPYNRSVTRTSLLVCIAADGITLKPFAIVPRLTTKIKL
jgi:hypothetical protein